MSLFTKKPLGVLDRIYGFVGGLSGVRGVDLSSDITLVHDLSRATEVNGYGGYSGYILWQGQTISGGGAFPTLLMRIADVQAAISRVDEDYELWVMEASAWMTSAAGFTNMTLAVGRDTGSAPIGQTQHAVRIGPKTSELQPVCRWYAIVMLEDSLGNTRPALGTHGPQITPAITGVVPFSPVRVPLGGFVMWLLNSTGAFTYNFTVRLWCGPLGARPPGIA